MLKKVIIKNVIISMLGFALIGLPAFAKEAVTQPEETPVNVEAQAEAKPKKESIFSKFKSSVKKPDFLDFKTIEGEKLLDEVKRESMSSPEEDLPLDAKIETEVVSTKEQPVGKSNIVIDSETLEYFKDRKEFEALGHAKIYFPSSNSTLKADKIIYNHDVNVITAYDNVTLLRDGLTVDGDFLRVDLNDEDNALMTNPISNTSQIEIQALNGYIYSDRLETDAGLAKFKEDMIVPLRSSSVGSFWYPKRDFKQRDYKLDEHFSDKYKIKANKIIIDRKEDHDIVTLKPAHIYYKGFKVMRAGDIKLVSNKEHEFVEIDGIELGSFSRIGMYLGYGAVLNVPGGATLKLGPTLNYGDSKFGFGGFARYRSPSNLTELAYGTPFNKVVLLGTQQITENLSFDYLSNHYSDEWFLGGRLFEYQAQLKHDKEYYLKDIDVNYRQIFSAMFANDYERRFSTSRFRWQSQVSKNLMHYETENKDYMFDLALIGQASASVYGTGDTQMIGRFGPSIRTNFKNWSQTISYMANGVHDGTPFIGDQYVYGKHSIDIYETLKLHKLLSVGWRSTIVPMKDNYMNKFLAENSFMLMLGPDEARLLLAYDAVRERTQVTFEFLLGTKNTDIEYKRLIMNDPNKSGKKKTDKNTKTTESVEPVETEQTEQTQSL